MQGVEKLAHDEHDLFESSLRIFLDLSEESMVRRITSRAPISHEELHRRLQSAHQERLMAKEYASVILSAE
jgi:guanylate kinase